MNTQPYVDNNSTTPSAIVEIAKQDPSAPIMFSNLNRRLDWFYHFSLNMNRRQKVILYALGIFICYFCFGILQEQITRGTYGEKNKTEKFQCTMALVFVQCAVNAIYAKIVMQASGQPNHDTTKTIYYALGAFTYLTAMVSSTMALKHVNYPTQVVGKSCKPIPVMILGVIISRKCYSLQKYFFVLMIVCGVAFFMYEDNKKGSTSGGSVLGTGEILLILSLTMDGLTGAFQERMRAEHQTKSGSMMLNMNVWSVGFLGIVILFTGELWQFLAFVKRHPFILSHLLILCIASALGQFFIFLTVTEFGPLTCSIITTTRKFFTVLGSVIFFGNTLSSRQWFGTSLVFTGLGLDSVYGDKKMKKLHTDEKNEKRNGDKSSTES